MTKLEWGGHSNGIEGIPMKKSLQTIGIVAMLVGAIFFGFLILENESNVSGATRYVGGVGPGNFTTIQDAINVSIDGDTVFVYNGTYVENVIVNRTINLIGMDMSNTTIDGNGIGDVVNVTSSWVNITGFTLTNCGSIPGDAALKFYMVTNCEISYSNLSSINGGGIMLISSDVIEIHDNLIENNYDGIFMFSSTNCNIVDNTISSNQNGLYFESSSGNTVYHNNIMGNTVSAFDDGTNTWNMLSPTGGNFWSDWYFPDADCDGFVDNPYMIAGGANQDDLPFTEASA
jgi:parallel beta-helix repeat protein